MPVWSACTLWGGDVWRPRWEVFLVSQLHLLHPYTETEEDQRSDTSVFVDPQRKVAATGWMCQQPTFHQGDSKAQSMGQQ